MTGEKFVERLLSENEIVDDGPTHKCGIVGAYYHEGQPSIDPIAFAMTRLSHRGQEGIGVAVIEENGEVFAHYESGVMNDSFRNAVNAQTVKAKVVLGHDRYSTSGSALAAQPIVRGENGHSLVTVHNGNLTNPLYLSTLLPENMREELLSDTYVLHQFICSQKGDSMEEKIKMALPQVEGAYSLILADPKNYTLYGIRDPYGFRPLYLGELNDGSGFILTSEDYGFQGIATKIDEVKRGEGIKIQDGRIESFFTDPRTKESASSSCIFELIYFAHPASEVFGVPVAQFRRHCGMELAIQDSKEEISADVVVPVRNSGTIAGEGYALQSNLPLLSGLLTNQRADRVFILPEKRKEALLLKFSEDRSVVEGKSLIVVDDSLVRGTTSREITKILRGAGASGVHWRIASPPIVWPCFYGIDFQTRKGLIAPGKNIEEIAAEIGADSLSYLPLKKTESIAMELQKDPDGVLFCKACFKGGHSPIKVDRSQLLTKY